MEPKIVKIPVWDLETDEIIEMEIDQDCLDAMDAADREFEEKFQAACDEDSKAWLYARDDE